MKKILASCLTCCTLLGSMCFSSPLAQLHAMSTEGGTATGSTTEKYDHDIELKVEEQKFPIRCTITKAPTFSHLIIKGLDSTYKYVIPENEGNGPKSIPYADGQFKTQLGEADWDLEFVTENTEKPVETYNVVINSTAGSIDSEDGKNNPTLTVDFSKSEFKFELPEGVELDETISGEFYKERRIVTNKTTEEVKPGDTFSLNLPEYFLNNFSSTSLALRNNAKSDFIKWDEITSDSSVTGTIIADAEAGKTISFDLKVKLENMPAGMTDYNPTLVTYNSETPGDPGDVNEELEPDEYLIPVEFKIVDDGKGDIIDEDEEYPVFLNLTPEYKKLTEKGETYKLDASVELDEDTDSEAKEYFEAMKKDGHFKVSFMSKNTDVATVSEDGTVTAVANGSTEIVAYVEGFEEDGLLATSKVDVEIAEKVEEEPEEADTTYPKTGDNFMAISAAILTLGISALVIALISKKQQQEDVNEEK